MPKGISGAPGGERRSTANSARRPESIDLIFARARYGLDYRMSPPDFNQEGRLALRGARHPLLEALFRGEPALPRATVIEEVPPDQSANGESPAPASAPAADYVVRDAAGISAAIEHWRSGLPPTPTQGRRGRNA